MTAPLPVRVLIVDDSAMARRVLSMGLSHDPRIEVVGEASSAEAAWTIMQAQKPDVITLDIEMPGMDGLTFLRTYLPKLRIPTVVISSLTREGAQITLRAMEAGAVDVIPKPTLGLADGLPGIMSDVCARVCAAAGARVIPGGTGHERPTIHRHVSAPRPPAPISSLPSQIIAIGSSTGGVQALSTILPMFPAGGPPIVIVQHMPEGFTGPFASRLDALCAMDVREARDGDAVEQGLILIAPGGNRHMALERRGRGYRVSLIEGDPVCFSRPAVDVLFYSVARLAGRNAAAAVLTGMGRDGSTGMLAIRHAGGRTVAQDEATSVVYGMPAAAYQIGAAEDVLPLEAIPARLLKLLPATAAPLRAV